MFIFVIILNKFLPCFYFYAPIYNSNIAALTDDNRDDLKEDSGDDAGAMIENAANRDDFEDATEAVIEDAVETVPEHCPDDFNEVRRTVLLIVNKDDFDAGSIPVMSQDSSSLLRTILSVQCWTLQCSVTSDSTLIVVWTLSLSRCTNIVTLVWPGCTWTQTKVNTFRIFGQLLTHYLMCYVLTTVMYLMLTWCQSLEFDMFHEDEVMISTLVTWSVPQCSSVDLVYDDSTVSLTSNVMMDESKNDDGSVYFISTASCGSCLIYLDTYNVGRKVTEASMLTIKCFIINIVMDVINGVGVYAHDSDVTVSRISAALSSLTTMEILVNARRSLPMTFPHHVVAGMCGHYGYVIIGSTFKFGRSNCRRLSLMLRCSYYACPENAAVSEELCRAKW